MRLSARLVLPAWAMLLLAVLPLVGGGRSLFLRDVTSTHLAMKHSQAEALREGREPLVDLLRSSGQPLAGNPNAVPFYPDNFLYRVAPFLWAFNAHFWLHLLLAPFAAYWMARSWGLDPRSSWATGVIYATSGFFLSQLNFYNLVAGTALAPALVAACLDTVRRPRRALVVALLWAALLCAGDPLLALQVGLLAASAVFLRDPDAFRKTWRRLSLAVLAGLLIAAPQWVEFLRILPASYRGIWGAQGLARTVASWDPRQAMELFLPFAFGRPDRVLQGRFWGFPFYTGAPPYFLSLYPGLLAWLLLTTSGRSRSRARLWAWLAIALGVALSLGRFNPLYRWVVESTESGLLRYPVKFWLPVALGASLLCGLGWARLERGEWQGFRFVWLGLFVAFLGAWVYLTLQGTAVEVWLGRWVGGGGESAGYAANERLRWAGLCLFSLVALAALGLVARSLSRGRRSVGPWLLALHAGLQLLFLKPMLITEDANEMLRVPAALEVLPVEASIFHLAYGSDAGSSVLTRRPFPTNDVRWLSRRARDQVFAFAGMLQGRSYELVVSFEGLDSFLARAARDLVKILPEERRLPLLAAWGVDRVVAFAPLDPSESRVRLLREIATEGGPIWIYGVVDPVPDVRFASRILRAADPQEAVARLTAGAFEASTTTVLAGEGESTEGAMGRILSFLEDGSTFRVEIEAPASGAIVFQRSHLPIYRAWVDDEEVAPAIADLYRVAVEVPAGARRVRLELDRRPSRWAFRALLVGVLFAFLLAQGRVSRSRNWVGLDRVPKERKI